VRIQRLVIRTREVDCQGIYWSDKKVFQSSRGGQESMNFVVLVTQRTQLYGRTCQLITIVASWDGNPHFLPTAARQSDGNRTNINAWYIW